MWQFSSHPWPESQTLGPCATLQPPMGTAGHCLRPSGSSRLCSLPSRFKTLQRCFAETKTSGLQGSYFHLPTAQPPAIELRKQEKSVFPSVSLCWPPAALQTAPRWRQGFAHPLEASWGTSLHQSSWQRKALGAQRCSLEGRELRMSFISSCLSLESSAQHVPQGPLPAQHLLCFP